MLIDILVVCSSILILYSIINRLNIYKLNNKNLKLKMQNLKLELKEKNNLLIKQSKLANIGETISYISHQWKQPLAQINSIVLRIDIYLNKQKLKNEVISNHLNEIEQMTAHMSDTLNTFDLYLKPNKEIENFNIKDTFYYSFNLISKMLESNNIKTKININDNLYIKGIAKEFTQVLLIIINNAKDVLIDKKILTPQIDINILNNKTNNKIILTIEDNGKGIEEQYLDKIFSPYFTTKNSSQGTGHGLYIAKMIVEKSMNGSIKAINTIKGAKFIIELNQKLN